METPRSVMSPACQLPDRALTALEQASVDELLEPGAFTAMGHLPAAGVLADALEYADRFVESLGSDDLAAARKQGVLLGAGLMPADASFLSQVMGLLDVAGAHDVVPDTDAKEGVTLGDLVEDARSRLLQRAASWREEPGRRSATFRVQNGEGGVLWPTHVVQAGDDGVPKVVGDADAFVVFAALPLLAPFLVLEEDCFVSPRLE